MSESLSQLLKTHTQKQAEVKKQNGKLLEMKRDEQLNGLLILSFSVEQLKKNAVQATNELTDSLTDYVNEG